MTSATIRAAMHNQPFRPFTLHLADGRSFTITHPDLIAVSQNGREAICYDEEGGAHFIDNLQVLRTFVQPVPEKSEVSSTD
jgi:hypothetical protein